MILEAQAMRLDQDTLNAANKLRPENAGLLLVPDPEPETVGSLYVPEAARKPSSRKAQSGVLVARGPLAPAIYGPFTHRLYYKPYGGVALTVDGVQLVLVQPQEVLAHVELSDESGRAPRPASGYLVVQRETMQKLSNLILLPDGYTQSVQSAVVEVIDGRAFGYQAGERLLIATGAGVDFEWEGKTLTRVMPEAILCRVVGAESASQDEERLREWPEGDRALDAKRTWGEGDPAAPR